MRSVKSWSFFCENTNKQTSELYNVNDLVDLVGLRHCPLYPPQVLRISLGNIDESIIDEERQNVFQPMFSTAHSSRRRVAMPLPKRDQLDQAAESSASTSSSEADQLDWDRVRASWQQGQPARFISDSSPDHVACGWLFDQSTVFVSEALLNLCDALKPVASRIKGVFRTSSKEWCSLEVMEEASREGFRLVPLAYRRESRFEGIDYRYRHVVN